jgi:nucleotide-binding universal stress UspA family protein
VYRTIVVGCDGSDRQADALALARQLRDPDGGRLVLAHVGRAEEIVAAAVEELGPGVRHEAHTVAGASAAAGLNELAERLDADVIVLGRSESGMLAEAVGLTTVQRLLHDAPCAVAVAAPDGAARFGTVAVAYDGSPEAELALTAAYAIAGATAASVVVCSVLEPIVVVADLVGELDDDEVEREVRKQLDTAASRAPAGVGVEQLLVRGSPPYAVLLEKLGDADLIVAGSRGHGALHRAVAGSTSASLLKDARTSVLVTRPSRT